MGSSTTKTDNTPWAPAQPYILKGLQSTQDVFDQNQQGLQDTSAQLKQGFNALAPQAFGANPLQDQTETALSDTIGGKYLAANPYLDGIMDTTNAAINNDVNGQFEAGGRYGSANHAGILAQKIGEADNSLQYQNYNDERTRQQAAILASPSVQAGRYAGVSPLLALAQGASSIPYTGVDALNGNVATASGKYGETTSTTSNPSGFLSGVLGAGATAAAGIWSDLRLKDVSDQIGTTPDGIPVVNYTLKGDPNDTPQTGVIAQDVAKLRPDALGPTSPGGLLSVDYSKLGLPDPTTLASAYHPDAPGQNFARFDAPTTPAANDSGPSISAPGPSLGNLATPISAAPVPLLSPPSTFNATNDPANAITLPNIPRIKPSFGDNIFNPDTNTTAGRIGLLGQYLMAADGSPFKAVGQGLIQGRQDQEAAAKQATDDAYKKAQLAAELRTANKPTLTTLKDKLISTPANGGPSTVIATAGPKTAEAPFGIVPDPTTGGYKALPGFETPADKIKREDQDTQDKWDHEDARDSRRFAEQEGLAAMREAAMLKAISMRGGGSTPPATTADGIPAGPYGKETLDYMLSQDLAGKTPLFGAGAKGTAARQQYQAYAAQQAKLGGRTGAADAAAHDTGAANAASLKKQTSGADLTQAGETTAAADLDRWLQASRRVPMIGVRPLDNAQQTVMGMFGNTENGRAVNDMQTAMADAHQKVARVISNLTTGAAATDAAQRRADAIFNGGDSVAVKVSKVKQLLAGMQNQTAGQRTQIAATTARISDVPANNNTPPIRIMGNADYRRLASGTRYTGPDGQVRLKR